MTVGHSSSGPIRSSSSTAIPSSLPRGDPASARGETDDALTAANAALEAALKAIGMRGSTLKELARSFKGSRHVRGYLENVPDLLEGFLNRLHALRSQEGDAHGKARGATNPHEALADLAVHLAGSFIVYLADVVPAAEQDETV
jgi:Abortive infection C-terminus